VVFTGLVIGAVAIGAYAYVSQSEGGWSPTDELGLARRDAPAHVARGAIVSGTVTSGAVKSRSDSAATTTERLQAARNSLLRDDVAAARAQLNAIRAARQNDDQVVELKRQLQEQADKEQRALAMSQVAETARPVEKAARASPSAPVKSAHSRENRLAARQHASRASSYARNQGAAETATTLAGGYSAQSGSVSAASALPRVSQQAFTPPVMNVVENTAVTLNTSVVPIAPHGSTPLQQPEETGQSALSKPQTEQTSQAIASPPLVQTMPFGGVVPKLDSGPKSRAQVRAEIVRAREDGSLPAFGNPDPAGPGGAPSLTGAPRP
jgi:hypothetical protein